MSGWRYVQFQSITDNYFFRIDVHFPRSRTVGMKCGSRTNSLKRLAHPELTFNLMTCLKF